MKKFYAALFATLLLSSCVGGTLSKQEDQEEYPLRSANKDEAKELKYCLKSLHLKQEKKMEKTKSYYSSIKAMKPDSACDDYKLKLKKSEGAFEIEAKKTDGDSTVMWAVNQDGVIEEILEPEDEEIEF